MMIIKRLIITLAGICGVFTALSALLYRIFLRTDIKMYGAPPDKESERWLKSIKYENTYITSREGIFLHGVYIENCPNKWVVLVHGYDADYKGMIPYARFLYEKGYSLLIPDNRGYGLSESMTTTMGHYEKYDVIDWVNKLVRDKNASDIAVLGVSMGASTVMLAAGEGLHKNVKAIVEDCGYTSVKEQFESSLRHELHLPPYPILWIIDIITRLLAKWSILKDANCLKAVKKINLPILFIHGSADRFVPFEMHEKLYENCISEYKEKLVVYGAHHATCYNTEPELYRKSVLDFLDKYMK